MKAYDREGRCDKCGEQGATIKWCPEIDAVIGLHGGQKEHLKRTCQRCGYSWKELPLDASSSS